MASTIGKMSSAIEKQGYCLRLREDYQTYLKLMSTQKIRKMKLINDLTSSIEKLLISQNKV